MNNIPIQDLLSNQITKQQAREKKEITSWHISKLGNCLRGVYLERLGCEPDQPLDDRTKRIFSVGKTFEDWFLDTLTSEEGVEIEREKRVEDLKLNVSGRVDAIIKYNGITKPYELKTKHSKSFWYMVQKGEGAMRQHEYQLWLYLFLLNMPEGNIVYISKDDLTILEYPVRLDNTSIEKEVMENLNILNDCWANKKLPPLPDPKSWQSKYCNHHKQCLALEKDKGRIETLLK